MPLSVQTLPRHVTAIESGAATAYRLQVRPDGCIHVAHSQTPPTRRGRPFILALAPSMVFRRRITVQPRNSNHLRLMGEQMLPFDSQNLRFGVARLQGALYLCGVARSDLEACEQLWGKPAAILVAPCDREDLRHAIEDRLSLGVIADLAERPRWLIGPAPVVTVALVAGLVGLVAGGWGVWNARYSQLHESLRQQIASLERETAPIVAQRRTIVRMDRAMQAHADFAGHTSAVTMASLTAVMGAMPTGTYLDSIDLTAERLVISGYGNDAATWLSRAQFPQSEVKITSLPKIDRFVASRPVGAPPQR